MAQHAAAESRGAALAAFKKTFRELAPYKRKRPVMARLIVVETANSMA